MNIRALTGFIDPGWPIIPKRIADIASCLKACREKLQNIGYEVQTLRLATTPPMKMAQPVPSTDRPELAGKLESACFIHDVDYSAIGPALPDEPDGYGVIPKVLRTTENVFASGIFADSQGGLSLPAAQACAEVILETSTIAPDGFTNLRFAALANVMAGSPFLPAAYHDGGKPAMAIATEAASVAVGVLKEAPSLASARQSLVTAIEDHALTLSRIAQQVAIEYGGRFIGIDFSLAPFPDEARSIGVAMEAMGVPAIGLGGTVAAAAFLTDCLSRAQFLRTGFCGLFLPVLEDKVLAARAAKGQLTINHLLLYATMCGTGLDTIPLPGDASPEAITSILIDVGVLSLHHNKPLTARLMPIPGKSAGDEIHFDFPYFADSCVMDLPAQPLSGLLSNAEVLYPGSHSV
jgi:uncharacterized protein (UPF0210 family)